MYIQSYSSFGKSLLHQRVIVQFSFASYNNFSASQDSLTQDALTGNVTSEQGLAHSIEVWQDTRLVGGLYGINVGQVFCGESMFSRVDNSSKLAFIGLCQHFSEHQGQLIDCQMMTEHLSRLGVSACSRKTFKQTLMQLRHKPVDLTCWQYQSITL